MNNNMTMLDWALGYLSRGLPIFPVCSPAGPGRCLEHAADKHGTEDAGKVPLVKWGEYQNRLPTEDEVRSWWARWPRANISMPTGHLCGMCVIDLDGSDARAEAERRGLPAGPIVNTGRVGGTHHYYAYRDDAPSIFAKANGIDFRGQGGYVLLPPSRHRSGATYTWKVRLRDAELAALPRWIDGLAGDRKRANGHAGVVSMAIPEHERNSTLVSMGGTMRRRGFGERAILKALLIENAERCTPPLDDDEVAVIAASVARYASAEAPPLRVLVDLHVIEDGAA
jgi:hypothetical protein